MQLGPKKSEFTINQANVVQVYRDAASSKNQDVLNRATNFMASDISPSMADSCDDFCCSTCNLFKNLDTRMEQNFKTNIRRKYGLEDDELSDINFLENSSFKAYKRNREETQSFSLSCCCYPLTALLYFLCD